MATNARPSPGPSSLSLLELHAPFSQGIERDATIIEIRLALAEYRARHDAEHWKLYELPQGRA